MLINTYVSGALYINEIIILLIIIIIIIGLQQDSIVSNTVNTHFHIMALI